MKFKNCFCTSLLVTSGALFAADYTWLSQPLSADWLGAANWNLGEWSENSANTATFGASEISDVNVNGEVALSTLTVNADTSFTNGTLALNGAFVVGADATAMVDTRIHQTDTGTSGTRFNKAGNGTLVLTGTNEFYRLRTSGGLLHFKGGSHDIVGTSTSPTEGTVILSLAKGDVLIDDGAVVTATNKNSYFSNSGAAVVISNATFKASCAAEFLNGFKDNNVLSSSASSFTVETNGVLQAGKFRLSKGTTESDTYGVLRVNRGGTLKLREFSMDATATAYKAKVIFDGARWEAINDGAASGTTTFYRLGSSNAESNWIGVKVMLGEDGLHYVNQSLSWFYKPVTSAVEHDGGVHFDGGSVTYWWGNNAYTGGNYLESKTGGAVLAVGRDTSFGAVPPEPTDNVFFRSGQILHFGDNVTTHPNRNFNVASNITANLGTQNGKLGRIQGTFSVQGTNSTVKISDWWEGWTEFCPPDNRTNTFNKLHVYGPLRIGSGTTLVTQNCGVNIDDNCALYIKGKTAAFNGYGNLTITGGVLRTLGPSSSYTIAKNYAQVNVLGGLFDTSTQREYINGLSGVARTTIAGTGELRASALRISQCDARNAETGLPLCEVNLCTGGVARITCFYIDESYYAPRGCLNLNGGTVIPRGNHGSFLGTSGNTNSERWTNILVRVCAGGAVFDTTNFTVTVRRPLFSGTEQDGGLTKKGAGTLTLTATNSYNGATRLEAGKLVFSHADGYPGGNLDVPGATLQSKDTATALVELQTLSFRDGCKVRVPGASALDEKTFGTKKVIAKMANALAKVPDLVFVDDAGDETPAKAWKLYLEDGGKTLLFGCSRGTVVIFR